MRRTSPECGTTPPSRYLQALLLLLFVAAPLPDCNAALSDNNTSTVVTRIERIRGEEMYEPMYAFLGIYPPVVLFNIVGRYHVRVNEIHEASTISYTIYFRSGTTTATQSMRSNSLVKLLRFDAPSNEFSGLMELEVQMQRSSVVSSVIKLSKIHCMPFKQTVATVKAAVRYYGFSLTVSATLPAGNTPSGYLLVPLSTNCLTVFDCDPIEGCYKIPKEMVLPPPGTYKLCVTANGWENRYLPWGQSSIDVTALVALPLTLAVGTVPSVTLFEAHTGTKVNWDDAWNVFLVRCRGGTCPTVMDQNRAEIVSSNACNKDAIKDSVAVSSSQLNAAPGVYAMCVVDRGGYATPATFPVRVVKEPFSMEVIKYSDLSLELLVSGGDIGDRIDRYAICIAEDLSPCSSVTLNNKCTWGISTNTRVLSISISKVAQKSQMTFCLVSRDVLLNDFRYLDVVGELKYVEPVPTVIDPLALAVIVVACVFLLAVIVGIIVFYLKKQKSNEELQFLANNWKYRSTMAPSAQSFHQSVLGEGLDGAYGEQFPSGYMPPAYASNHSLMDIPREEMMFSNAHGSWVQQ